MSQRPGAATVAGLLVTVTACLVTLLLAVTTCALYLRGELEAAKDAAIQAGGALAATLALVATVTRRADDGQTGPVPVTVTDEPVTVQSVDDARRDWKAPDPGSSAVDAIIAVALLLMVAAAAWLWYTAATL